MSYRLLEYVRCAAKMHLIKKKGSSWRGIQWFFQQKIESFCLLKQSLSVWILKILETILGLNHLSGGQEWWRAAEIYVLHVFMSSGEFYLGVGLLLTFSAYSEAICLISSDCRPTIWPTALAVSLPCTNTHYSTDRSVQSESSRVNKHWDEEEELRVINIINLPAAGRATHRMLNSQYSFSGWNASLFRDKCE